MITIHTSDMVDIGKINYITKGKIHKPNRVRDYNINVCLVDDWCDS